MAYIDPIRIDPRYINVSIEAIDMKPIDLEELMVGR